MRNQTKKSLTIQKVSQTISYEDLLNDERYFEQQAIINHISSAKDINDIDHFEFFEIMDAKSQKEWQAMKDFPTERDGNLSFAAAVSRAKQL